MMITHVESLKSSRYCLLSDFLMAKQSTRRSRALSSTLDSLLQPTLLDRHSSRSSPFLEVRGDADSRRSTCGVEMLVAAAFSEIMHSLSDFLSEGDRPRLFRSFSDQLDGSCPSSEAEVVTRLPLLLRLPRRPDFIRLMKRRCKPSI